MGRKASIINSLEIMGYTVGDENGIYSVVLVTDDNIKIIRRYSEEQLIYSHSMLEKIVGDMNETVKKYWGSR